MRAQFDRYEHNFMDIILIATPFFMSLLFLELVELVFGGLYVYCSVHGKVYPSMR
jgi:hypothetical protein